jgi:hypothetical protein
MEAYMSIEARKALVDHPHTFFQAQSQRDDLLDPNKTRTELIALLTDLVNAGHIIEFTAIKSDHHDDSDLGEHCHFNGYCADCWPLASASAGDYLDASDERFAAFLRDAAHSQWLYQIGLAGSAYTERNVAAAGPSAFHDDGGDHVHLGAK